MNIEVLNKYQDLVTTEDGDGWRWYGSTTQPYLYPSVTTIINEVYNNIPLNEWKAKNSVNACEKRRDETADIGTEIHRIFEETLKPGGQSVPEYGGHLDKFVGWCEKDQVKPLATEFVVVSEKYGFAGRVDFVGEAKGKVRVLDWKTGNHWGDSWGPQVAAYQVAVSEMMGVPDTGSDAVGFGIYHSPRDTPLQAKALYFQHLEWVHLSWFRMLDTFKDQPRFTKLKKMNWPYLMQRSVTRA